MARCGNCGCNDADPDWGLCYECFCVENDRSGGALSSVAAINYDRMGMASAAASCRTDANNRGKIKSIKDYLETHPERINEVIQMLHL